MKAIDIVKYMVENDLTKDDLEELALIVMKHVPDEDLLEEIKRRM